MSTRFNLPCLTALSLSLLASLALSGCAGFETTASNPAATPAAVITGNVHGGQQPVSNAHIYFYAASTGGYGAASASILNTAGAGVSTDSNGVGYVTTDANGNYSVSTDYTCPSSGMPVYLLAVGGNPGLQPSTVNNTAITLMAEVGSCALLTSSTLVNINEVTTAAAVTALQQFLTTPTHMGTTSSNVTGFNVAAGLVANIVDRASGQARATTLLGTGVTPQSKLNSIANLLVPCINSASYNSAMCSQLFSAATPSGGTQPTDVASAMLLIAQNPGNNVPTLFSYSTTNAAFQPALGTAPNDFTLGITYSGGGLTAPGDVVIDAAGDAFTANCPTCNGGTGASSIVGFSPAGAVLTGASGLTAGVTQPQGLAIDQEGDVWVADSGRPGVLRMNTSGNPLPGFPVTTPTAGPIALAVDANSNAWVTSPGSSSVFEVTNTGTLQNTNTNFTAPYGIGIDGYGYIFVADQAASDIARLSNTGSSLATFNAGGISGPISIAIDHSDQIWTVDNTTNNISKVGGINGGPAAGSPYPGGYQLAVLAIAGDGSVWFANCKAGCPGSGAPNGQPDNVIHVSSAGAYLTSTNGYQDPHFNGVGTAAIDRSGNLWVSNSAGGSLTELLGVAAPVITPLATASQFNGLGIRP